MSSSSVLSAIQQYSDKMAFSKLINRLKKAFGVKCANEQPCEPLEPTGSTTENHRHLMTDDPAVAAGKQAGRQKKRKLKLSPIFFACFSRRRATVVDQLCVQEIHELHAEPISSSKFFCTAVSNLELEVLQPPALDAPADEDLDSKPEVNSFDSAVVIENDSAELHFPADNESSLSEDSLEQELDSPPSSPFDEDNELPVSQQLITDDMCDSALDENSNPLPDQVSQEDSAVKSTADDGTCLDNNDISCRYKLGKQLGEGGFGSVYEGIRIQDGLQVAVKFVQKTPNMQDVSSSCDQPLPLEITLANMASGGSRCPNIIQLLDWQVFKNHYVMVMERPSPSMDLEAFLEVSGGVLSEKTAHTIMRQAVYAANVCCYRGVFHRDIKLQNLLVNPDTLEVKLIDFGCGDFMMESAYSLFSGTEAYIPPEFYEKGCYRAKPATVYSLGVLLFTMLHGEFPSAYDLYYLQHDWSKFTLSQECCDMMTACLHENPECRIPLEEMPYHDWSMLEF
ncbi:serine/threonine-protein kinase pim-2-like [Danio rerio]|uniref:non-specific serine/threonine protein kinase n=1 Tax=Danio rerio TaxID=7955 RepID=A0A8M9QA37_DANRE|nr:serine/threonine-protein kinase pim-2-like [Danio rerio]XP_021336408.1 serine/threonine-protein kinase pim-2-like [Danio rerio]|eukprot:XP_021328334.1 serine/threonine-protein kinase pim-2-like [Danio rerio]